MLKTRLIARLDIRNDKLIKPICLEGVRVVGDPIEYARRYNDDGIDEILFMDTVASLYGRNSLESLITLVSDGVFCPMTVGGGLRNIGDVIRIIRAGADKVAINTGAIQRPELITEVANRCGSQAMVLQIDAKRTESGWEAYTKAGRQHTGKDVLEWAKEGTAIGAGEILLTSIDKDGTRSGTDTDLIRAVSSAVSVPVIASGGVGASEHFIQSVHAGASAVAMADCLHFSRLSLAHIREKSLSEGIAVRT